MSDAPSSSGPKDVFLHLLSIATLYVTVVDVLVLLFEYINHLLPDPLSYVYGADLESIRFFTASIIIVFPVFLLTSWLLRRDLHLVPAKADMRIRKWLLYLTLFIASITIIIDLITLVYFFLSGDVALRFLLKVLAVFVVAGAVFGYELWDLHAQPTLRSRVPRVALWTSSAIVLLIILGDFLLIGSPFTQRELRFDQQRVNDLQTIQGQLIDTWQRKGALPQTLDELRNDISGFVAPQDPQTSAAYGYTRTSVTRFRLCATFSRPSPTPGTGGASPLYERDQNWSHGSGSVCFDRTIDPVLYPRVKTVAPPVPAQ